jgi:HSP20 family protein
MTFYVRSPFNLMRRQMLDTMLNREWPEYESNLLVPMDVKAEDGGYEITVSLPGVKAEDLNIQVVNESVTVSGEIKHNRADDANYLLSERAGGRFSRTITLPMSLDASKAEADLTNGVLVLRVPKAQESLPKSIKVVSKN